MEKADMEENSKIIWCATCAAKLCVPAEGERGDTVSARWGVVGVSFVRCDFCRVRLMRGRAAVAITIYDRPEDYRPWEGELLETSDAIGG